MAIWPVRITERSEILQIPRVPIRFGGEVLAAPIREHDESGDLTVIGMTVGCPRCGSFGTLGARGQMSNGAGFSFEPETPHAGDALTIDPSITCSCGGAYRLTSGVLRDL